MTQCNVRDLSRIVCGGHDHSAVYLLVKTESQKGIALVLIKESTRPQIMKQHRLGTIRLTDLQR